MPLDNRKVIITGGPTREWLDPVRFISNPSSGKMGGALADEAHSRGCGTVFIHGPVNAELTRNRPYRCAGVDTTEDLLNAVLSEVTPGSLLVMAAAPSDYTPVEKSGHKIKKDSGEMVIRLQRTPDILKAVNERKKAGLLNGILVAGFAAETRNTEEYALGKMKDKDLDMICLNDVSMVGAGFAGDTNRIIIFDRFGGRMDLPLMSKREAAHRIFDYIEEIFTGSCFN